MIWIRGDDGWSVKVAQMNYFYFRDKVNMGYAICLLMLSYRFVEDFVMARWRSGCLNLCLAAFCLWLFLTTRGWAIS